MKQTDVAEAIRNDIGTDRVSGSAVSEWERFNRHPAVDVMASWARVVGLRLVVELDDARSGRVAVLLRPRAAEIARAIDQVTDPEKLRTIEQVVEMALR